MTYRLGIFDFDGTLADSFDRVKGAFGGVAERHGSRTLTEDQMETPRGRDNRTSPDLPGAQANAAVATRPA